ncbi:alpha/beta fold hydrolase [Goodfellowiella coeruleoviolacea]|uniref:Nucleoside-diphosphate-sugar epimerase n=1 Tax=Goodfellowiella coeruleoviolacea TaxID=334858 RepID=A0AAE3KK31_9PSEU|nr:alpha/beta fold hydrolase [Goodfellowiella coeruleoviolacea]MCP2169747.1 Nucleoside-diphosphate-sugar epimerase [Goodfellowiella coeruleoviolacea]
MSATDRHALVFGATGLIGRHLVLALGQAGVRVSTANRSRQSHQRLVRWLADHGHHQAPADLRVDFTQPEPLSGRAADWADVTEIHNCAGAYRFGMSGADARRANVDSARAVVALAARLPRLRRVVHVSGYRVGGQDPALVPWSDEHRRRTYAELGAYEASKAEADAVFQAAADQAGLPWTIVNPASVIGDSATGESDQQLGLAASLRDLWRGALPALPGDERTFVPVVAVDHLARFMAVLPLDEATERAAYWVLDDATPALPELLTLVARHYQVRVPRLRVPVSLVRRLPQWVTRTDPETLTFLSADRYPTGPATAVATRHGLAMPDTTTTVLRWADHLAAYRFGEVPAGRRRFTAPADVRTFELGAADAPTVVLPGPPGNADTWAPVAGALGQARVVDLPGLGLSRGRRADWPAWSTALVTETGARHLVGHGGAAALAVRAALAHPDLVDQLTLVSPFAPGTRVGRAARWTPLVRWRLARVSAEALARQLTGDPALAETVASSAADLRRGRVAATAARLVADAGGRRWRHQLWAGLQRYPGRVHVIVGADDPLGPAERQLLETLPRATVTAIAGAGHHPHLTHPAEVAAAIGGAPVDTPHPPRGASPAPAYRR